MKIHVSSLNEYSFCPRCIYLRHILKVTPEKSIDQILGIIGHGIRKELSLRQYRMISGIKSVDEIQNRLLDELDKIIIDLPFIYREKFEGFDYSQYIPQIKSEILREINVLNEKLCGMIEELGLQRSLELLTPWKVEFTIKSDELKLSGRIDKIMKFDTLIPYEIKTGDASEDVWEGDRLQLGAYAILLEEKFDTLIPYGYVEYTRIHEKRPVLITEQLRRRVINTRDNIIDILNGKIPEICSHGSGAKCDACGYKEECYKI